MLRTTCCIPLVLAALVLGCGSDDTASGGGTTTAASTAEAGVSVRVTSPSEGASVGSGTEVAGVVTPATATVDVNGEAATVAGGRFTASVQLEPGEDQVVAVAAAAGATAQSVVAVDRQPTAEERRAAEQRRAARARAAARKRAAEARRAAAAKARRAAAAQEAAAAGTFTMPNEVGSNLQAAQDHLQRLSGNPLFFSDSQDATGDDRFQILDRDWQVCGQSIAPGDPVSEDSDVVFDVVKAYEDCP